MAEDTGEGDSMDFISSLPDEILHHILSFLSTDLAVKTCVLSRRWRYIWRDTHSISLNCDELSAYSVHETLNNHKAPKLLSFHLGFRFASDLFEFPGGPMSNHEYFVADTWIEFAHSRHPENLSLDFYLANYKRYSFPDNLYLNSSVKRLSLVLHGCTTLVPRATVSWPFLKELLLDGCNIPNESAVEILSGCPLLESLTVKLCRLLGRLDLSNSMHLTRLEVDLGPTYTGPGPTEIVAPHIHFLRLKSSQITSSLDHVSSLTEAKLDMFHDVTDFTHLLDLKLLAKLHKIDKLTLGAIFLQILSVAELRGVPFPTLKITALTLETEISQYAVPGIARLLQHSPELKKLTLHLMKCKTLKDKDLTSYTDSRGLGFEVFPNSLETKLASFIEFLLENTKTLETMVLRLEDHLDEAKFEELLQMATTLSNNHNNVSIVLINPPPIKKWRPF